MVWANRNPQRPGRNHPPERRRWYHADDRDNPEVGKDDDPRWTESHTNYWLASDRHDEVSIELAGTVPTTMKGIVALLDYMNGFAQGQVRLSDTNHSSLRHLPDDLTDDSILDSHGRPLTLPFYAWIDSNVSVSIGWIGPA